MPKEIHHCVASRAHNGACGCFKYPNKHTHNNEKEKTVVVVVSRELFQRASNILVGVYQE
jgi:hypothetical protein